ncbi:hypothetical protein M2139_001503 [Enterococcus sp. PF1-24]|uniref:SpaA isopeptide-forming pilin-related protein n=1 Tax=unclassified Enterococcus TaxID=2608891 RepID=UPI0024753F55|nr:MULTISPECIES: SpaA isopeptide-forming pilin-related protein [unclassified Enterococcus]MDH6364506.1 hypothetical protein [Enterococcus sp. PFB1-1]MDH6401617.1 hypothetical protein [Enterococcus sp. PF1-24]
MFNKKKLKQRLTSILMLSTMVANSLGPSVVALAEGVSNKTDTAETMELSAAELIDENRALESVKIGLQKENIEATRKLVSKKSKATKTLKNTTSTLDLSDSESVSNNFKDKAVIDDTMITIVLPDEGKETSVVTDQIKETKESLEGKAADKTAKAMSQSEEIQSMGISQLELEYLSLKSYYDVDYVALVKEAKANTKFDKWTSDLQNLFLSGNVLASASFIGKTDEVISDDLRTLVEIYSGTKVNLISQEARKKIFNDEGYEKFKDVPYVDLKNDVNQLEQMVNAKYQGAPVEELDKMALKLETLSADKKKELETKLNINKKGIANTIKTAFSSVKADAAGNADWDNQVGNNSAGGAGGYTEQWGKAIYHGVTSSGSAFILLPDGKYYPAFCIDTKDSGVNNVTIKTNPVGSNNTVNGLITSALGNNPEAVRNFYDWLYCAVIGYSLPMGNLDNTTPTSTLNNYAAAMGNIQQYINVTKDKVRNEGWNMWDDVPNAAGHDAWVKAHEVKAQHSNLNWGFEMGNTATHTGMFNVYADAGGGQTRATSFGIYVKGEQETPKSSVVKIKKVDADTGAGLGGMRIEYSVNGGTPKEQNSDGNGDLHVGGLKPGDTFHWEEIKAPAGYILETPNPSGEVVLVEGDNIITIENRKEPTDKSEFRIKKVDENGNPLPGAKFELKLDETVTKTTDANGYIAIDNLTVGMIVAYEEIEAPAGYLIDPTTSKGTVTIKEGDNLITVVNPKEVIPPGTGNVVLKKVDQHGNVVEGAEFDFEISGETKSYTTATNGGITIPNLEVGTVVSYEETKAPAGYTIDPATSKGTITIVEGENVINVVNTKDEEPEPEPEKAIVELVKKGDDGKLLAGVKFDITINDKTETMTTDSKGKIQVKELEVGTIVKYKEVEAPEGYLIDENSSEGQVTLTAGTNTINVVNIKKPDKGTVKLVKTGDDGLTLEGVKFEITIDGKTETMTTDKNGVIEIEDLTAGTKLSYKEVAAPKGYSIDKDSSEGEITVSKDGNVITVVNPKKPQPKGAVELTKTVETLVGFTEKEDKENGKYNELEFKQVLGEGFGFKIKAKADIKDNDDNVVVKKGEFVQVDGKDLVLTTSKAGVAKTDKILVPGKYELIEVSAPAGVVLSEKGTAFEITADEDKAKDATVSIENELQELTIEGIKKQEFVDSWKGSAAVIDLKDGNGQVFALGINEDLAFGKETLKAGSILAYTTVKKGEITFKNVKLPNKEVKFFVKEIKANESHVLDKTVHEFTFKPSSNKAKETITVKPAETKETADKDGETDDSDSDADSDKTKDTTSNEEETEETSSSDDSKVETKKSKLGTLPTEETTSSTEETTETSEKEEKEDVTTDALEAFINRLSRGNFDLLKIDAETEVPLAGAEFELFYLGEKVADKAETEAKEETKDSDSDKTKDTTSKEETTETTSSTEESTETSTSTSADVTSAPLIRNAKASQNKLSKADQAQIEEVAEAIIAAYNYENRATTRGVLDGLDLSNISDILGGIDLGSLTDIIGGLGNIDLGSLTETISALVAVANGDITQIPTIVEGLGGLANLVGLGDLGTILTGLANGDLSVLPDLNEILDMIGLGDLLNGGSTGGDNTDTTDSTGDTSDSSSSESTSSTEDSTDSSSSSNSSESTDTTSSSEESTETSTTEDSTETTETSEVEDKDEDATATEDKKETRVSLGIFTTDKKGKISVKDLPTGSYEVVEVKAPAGYMMSKETYTFEITPETDGETVKIVAENVKENENVGIQTKAHDGEGNQTFTYGDVLKMYDDVEITHDNILDGTKRAFQAILVAEIKQEDGSLNQEEIWTSEIIDYEVSDAAFTKQVVSKEIDSSKYPEDTHYFFKEIGYKVTDKGEYVPDSQHNFDGTDKDQDLTPIKNKVTIKTKAHDGEGNQTFTHGDVLNMYDDVEITHDNILDGTKRAFQAILVAVVKQEDGTFKEEDIWTSEIIDYEVSDAVFTKQVVSEKVDTSKYPKDTHYFFKEIGYKVTDKGEYVEDSKHNFDGKDKDQDLTPKEAPAPSTPKENPGKTLPETGYVSTQHWFLYTMLVALVSVLVADRIKNKKNKAK